MDAALARNVVQTFFDRVALSPDAVAAQFKQAGTWQALGWKQLADQVRSSAQGLLALGVAPGTRICLMGETRLEWIIQDLAIQAVGAITVPIYQSYLAEDCRYAADNCGAQLVFVDAAVHAAKFTRVRDRLQQVRHVVQYLGDVQETDGWVRSAASLLPGAAAFAATHPGTLDERMAAIRPEDLSTIIYTSGTTGLPKGVMLTHDNFVFTASAVESIQIITSADLQLFFLPLAHVFAQIIKVVWFRTGHPMAFAESVGKLIEDMGEVHPTMMAAVPRVFEKAFAKVASEGASAPGLRGALFRRSLRAFEKAAQARDLGHESHAFMFLLARWLVFPELRRRLAARFGGKLKYFISGGAPLSPHIGLFFDLAGVQILEGYGLSETCAASCINRPGKNHLGTVGPPLPGTELKIAEDGEILIRGRSVMKGYWANPEATSEALVGDGWFASGDIGRLEADGSLRITDRKKDLVVTANGKKIPPQNLENALKAAPIISQALVYGDRRQYLTALIALSEEQARAVARQAGVVFRDFVELTRHPRIRAHVQKVIDAVNAVQPSYQTIRKFDILPRDLTQEDGELTPTLKIKRKVCNERFKALFDRMYGQEAIP